MKTRIDIINHIAAKFAYCSYLEIGLRDPTECFNHIDILEKHSVDPGLETKNNAAQYKYTSDEFFALLESGGLDKRTNHQWDLIFIDGLHVSHQVERDVENSLKHLSENGTIILHDCNPPTEYHARCDYYDFSTPAGGCWNGTVWKAVYKLRCHSPKIDVCVVDEDWGCGVIRRGAQKLCEFDNPYYEYSKFAENREHHLNLVDAKDVDAWLDSPFYK